MKKLIAVLAIVSFSAYSSNMVCTTHVVVVNGQTQTCQVCCLPNGYCTTYCR